MNIKLKEDVGEILNERLVQLTKFEEEAQSLLKFELDEESKKLAEGQLCRIVIVKNLLKLFEQHKGCKLVKKFFAKDLDQQLEDGVKKFEKLYAKHMADFERKYMKKPVDEKLAELYSNVIKFDEGLRRRLLKYTENRIMVMIDGSEINGLISELNRQNSHNI